VVTGATTRLLVLLVLSLATPILLSAVPTNKRNLLSKLRKRQALKSRAAAAAVREQRAGENKGGCAEGVCGSGDARCLNVRWARPQQA
jgi:hypothetical protein